MKLRAANRLPLLVVWILIVAYGVFFSALSIQRHSAFLTHASDLGQIDQAIWNTLHGHLLESTRATGVQGVRLSDHVEPIFVPLSLVFLVDDNVESLLVVQSFAIAIGALAVFWIARKRWAEAVPSEDKGPWRFAADWAPVGFAAMYLIFPALEAANLAEFHAVTLAPAPLLFAYHYGTEKAWGRFAAFSILALLVKEEIALLVFVMAAWFAVQPLIISRSHWLGDLRRMIVHPLAAIRERVPFVIAVLAAFWFIVAVFVIIPRFSPLGHSIYTCRYISGEDCREVARGLFLVERLGYIGQLLASVGWIALLDPLSLALGIPLLAANVLSNYPAQYSGTFHYSAPVAPFFVLAAIGGSVRAIGWLRSRLKRQSAGLLVPLAVLGPVFVLALAYHMYAGYSPIGGAFDWPSISAHDLLFSRFAGQVANPHITLSTTASLNPHLSHRPILYRYPIVNGADYVLLDVSESTTGNPTDFAVAYHGLVDKGAYGVVDASDGYILLKRGAKPSALPDDFYSMFRANQSGPTFKTVVDFSDKLRFLGYDLSTDQYGRGSVRMYWQRLQPLHQNYDLFLFYADEQGQPRADVTLDSTVLYWYPTSMWQADEVVIGQTVPMDLGPHARVGLAVLDGNDFGNVDSRLPLRQVSPTTLAVFDNSTWIELANLQKDGNQYVKQQLSR